MAAAGTAIFREVPVSAPALRVSFSWTLAGNLIYALCQFGLLSTLAKLGSAAILEVHRILCGGIQPDLTILMDSDVGASVERARRRNKAKSADVVDESRFESENRAFFTRVHSAYLEIAKREPERVVLVNARGTPDQTHAKIMELVFSRIDLSKSPRRTQNAG